MPSKPGFTDTVCALTTRIFRCHGLAPCSERHDQLGGRDLVFWLAFAAIGAAWYFLLFQPTRERNAMLAGRLTVLQAQLRAEQVEQTRLQREIQALARGAPDAWERAARIQLGWLQPGEVTDRDLWRRDHPQWADLAQPTRPPRRGTRPVLTMRLYPAVAPPALAPAPAVIAGARPAPAPAPQPALRLPAAPPAPRPVLAHTPPTPAPPRPAPAGPVPAATVHRR